MSNYSTEKVPAKLPDPSRLPLVELAPTEAQEIPGSAASSTHNITEGGADAVQENGETDTRKEQTAQSKVSKDGSKRRSLIESYIEQMYIMRMYVCIPLDEVRIFHCCPYNKLM